MIDATYSTNHVAALANRASIVTSYKPAPLKAIVRLVRRGANAEIPLQTLGHEFVAMYWTQTIVFRLRQDFGIVKESKVVRAIRQASEHAGVRDLSRLSRDRRTLLDARVAKILPINVLGLFHMNKPETMGDLYSWSPGDDAISISPQAYFFIGANSAVLESIANLWWARFLERRNGLAPLVIEKVEGDGVRRENLSGLIRILRQSDGNRCFYCDDNLAGPIATHVDHVIPWSFLLDDPPWDLVLACATCNLEKSDRLPAETFVQKLVVANLRRRLTVFPRGRVSPFLQHDDEFERYHKAALSVEWPSGWSPSRLS